MYNSKIKTQKYQTPHQPGKKNIYITLKVTVANSCEKQHDRYLLESISTNCDQFEFEQIVLGKVSISGTKIFTTIFHATQSELWNVKLPNVS